MCNYIGKTIRLIIFINLAEKSIVSGTNVKAEGPPMVNLSLDVSLIAPVNARQVLR